VNAFQLMSSLDRLGITYIEDDDGDVMIRTRSDSPGWIDAVYFEFDSGQADFSIRGEFLNAHASPRGDGSTLWQVPVSVGRTPTAIAQKVVTVYLMPRSDQLLVQVHAAVAPLSSPRPLHLRIAPSASQVDCIRRSFDGMSAKTDGTQFWMMARLRALAVDDRAVLELVQAMFEVGRLMFDGPFTGWMYQSEV